jgi:hypothetical protein
MDSQELVACQLWFLTTVAAICPSKRFEAENRPHNIFKHNLFTIERSPPFTWGIKKISSLIKPVDPHPPVHLAAENQNRKTLTLNPEP